jgi:uncharacterized protein YbgA (DUF1722 family)/uncharacterized protein YbbK (DUF523 family)
MQHTEKPRIVVSACLLGKEVRHDGSHRNNKFISEKLAQFIDIDSVFPEMELGLGVPRAAIQLRRRPGEDEIRLVFSKQPEQELTGQMREIARERLSSLDGIDGYILKKDSPSCGLYRVAVFDEKTGQRQKNGMGIFASELVSMHPDLPVEDEGRLHDDAIRENFLERVYAHMRWRRLATENNTLKAFRQYHQRYKLLLMAKNDVAYRKLGRLVAGVNQANLDEVMPRYFSLFMQTMAIRPRRGHHVNVLQHVMGYLKRHIDSHDKAEILEWLDNYRQHRVKRDTPVVLLKHHLRRYPSDYLASQYYFAPYPGQLMTPDGVST